MRTTTKRVHPVKLRFILVLTALTALALWMCSFSTYAATNTKIQLTTTGAVPRAVEDTTAQAVARDYAKAWEAMSAARDHNRPDLLADMFAGYAKNELTQAILDQRKANIRTRYIDRAHKLQAVFYSQEGSALQLRDTAQVTIEVLDGNNVVHTEDATINYVVLMTPAADHWQVRKLQAVPSF
jgi:hypothetical protein